MFAVEGWKLGAIVAQTGTKNKLKRKRGEGDDAAERKAVQAARPSSNPFMMRSLPSAVDQMQSMASPGESQLSIKKKKKKKSKHSQGTETKPNHQPPDSHIEGSKNSKHENRKKHKHTLHTSTPSQPKEPEEQAVSSIPSSKPLQSPRPDTKPTPLQQKMRAKLSGSQFRHINEKLYTTDSSEALSLFTDQPALFRDYHEGFRHQVQSWPTNPIDVFIDLLSKSSKSRLTVADLGCGDAALARHFRGNNRIIVHSYDLVKVNEFVEACDMAHVPLRDDSVDISIFCLSLMGTNFLTFIREACRYTKLHGEIWIAEIKSRFLDPSFESFIKRLKGMGLKWIELNKEEKMFVIMRFERVQVDGAKDTGLSEDELLKACLYKKR